MLTLVARLRELRQERGVRLKDIAEATGLPLDRARGLGVNAEQLQMIAITLGVSIREILDPTNLWSGKETSDFHPDCPARTLSILVACQDSGLIDLEMRIALSYIKFGNRWIQSPEEAIKIAAILKAEFSEKTK